MFKNSKNSAHPLVTLKADLKLMALALGSTQQHTQHTPKREACRSECGCSKGQKAA